MSRLVICDISGDKEVLYKKLHSRSLHYFTNHNVHSFFPTLREGKNQNEKTFGIPAEKIFQAIYRSVLTLLLIFQQQKCVFLPDLFSLTVVSRSEEEMLKFMGLMNSSWVLDGHDIATAFNLSGFQSIMDLGGERSNVILWMLSTTFKLQFVTFHVA